MPSFICAWAVPVRARPKPSARPANSRFVIREFPSVGLSGGPAGRPKPARAVGAQSCVFWSECHPGSTPEKGSSSPPLAPGQRSRPFVEPVVLRRHLTGADKAVADRADRDGYGGVDEVVMQGEQLALEQGEVNEAHRPGEQGEVEDALPI